MWLDELLELLKGYPEGAVICFTDDGRLEVMLGEEHLDYINLRGDD